MFLLIFLIGLRLLFGPPLTPIEPIYTHYNLALKKCTKSSPWTIHGLWADLNDRIWPQFCANFDSSNKTTFNHTALAPFWNQLKTNWTSCDGDIPDLTLWSHEWYKHGTCLGVNQSTFIQTTLKLYNYSMDLDLPSVVCRAPQNNMPIFTGWYDQCFIPFNLNNTFLRS